MTYYESLTPRSPDYRVFVTPEGGSRTELSVTCAWQHQPGSFNYDTELESAASWVWSGKALVEVEAVNPSIVLQNVVIRPRKAGIVPAVLPERRLVSFAVDASLAAHRILSVEIDGIARPLFLFTDPPLEAPEDLLPETPGANLVYAPPAGSDSDVLTAEDICALSREHSVLVFRKGIYNLEPFVLKKDGITWYLEEGAVIRLMRTGDFLPDYGGGFYFTGTGIRILGRGTFDGKWSTDRFSKPLSCHGYFLEFSHCRDVLAEGFTISHSIGFCLVSTACENVVFRGIRTLGSQDMTSNDGILIDGSKHALVEGCFANNHDDALEVKTHAYARSETRDVTFKDCVVWNRGGMPLAAAWETWFDIRDVRWQNISVIHQENYGNGALCVYVGNRAHVENLLFEDIDVEDTPFGGICITAEEHPWSIWGTERAARHLGEELSSLSKDPNDNWPYIGNIVFKNIRITHSVGFNSDFYPRPKPPGNGNGHGGRGYKLHVPVPEFPAGHTKVRQSHLTGPIVFENVWIDTYRDQQSFSRYGRGEDHDGGRPIPGHFLTDLVTDNWILWEGVNPQLWELEPPRTPEEVYSPAPDEEGRRARIAFWEEHVRFAVTGTPPQ